MKELGLYTIDVEEIRSRVRKAGMADAFRFETKAPREWRSAI